MNEKRGQLDLAKLRESLSGAGDSIMSGLRSAGTSAAAGLDSAGNNISAWWQSLPDDVKRTALRTAVGAGGGALLAHTATGGFADREYRPGLSPALLGALLGGGAAFAAPYGMRMLSGDIKFAPKTRPSLIDRSADTLVGGAVSHPGAVAGGVGAATIGKKWMPTYGKLRAALNSRTPPAGLAELMDTAAVRGYTPTNPSNLAGVTAETARFTRGPNALINLWKAPGRSLRNFGNYLRGSNIPPEVARARDLARVVKNPKGVVAGMLGSVLLGMLADRYAFGRHD